MHISSIEKNPLSIRQKEFELAWGRIRLTLHKFKKNTLKDARCYWLINWTLLIGYNQALAVALCGQKAILMLEKPHFKRSLLIKAC